MGLLEVNWFWGRYEEERRLNFQHLVNEADWLHNFLIQFDTNMQWDDLERMIFNRFQKVDILFLSPAQLRAALLCSAQQEEKQKKCY